jgi:methylmalonyl-CoA mutase cobalamin-binding subunit
MSNLYASISVDEGFHPDDDFEQIIERMLDQIEQDVV